MENLALVQSANGSALKQNLPLPPTPLVGRTQEITEIKQLLRQLEVRLLTITGPAGVGKTRLSLQVAHGLIGEFMGGISFVSLAHISDARLVYLAIAQSLGIKEIGPRALLEILKDSLQGRRLLLLDNFEQVINAADQVANLLAVCPTLKILVTSREALRVRAEQQFTLSPLRLPETTHISDLSILEQNEAVALFVQRSRAVKPDFQLTSSNALSVAEICTRLDGLPLAIALAAARIKVLSPQALLALLSQRLRILTGGARDEPVRHQTLRNTLEWSYNLLDAAEQQLFRRLSVFAGGFTLDEVETICALAGDEVEMALDVVASLVDKSLLQQHGSEEEEARFAMLETIREYALEVLDSSGEAKTIQQRHATYFLQFAEHVSTRLLDGQQAAGYRHLEREHENLRTALQWFIEQKAEAQILQLSSALGVLPGRPISSNHRQKTVPTPLLAMAPHSLPKKVRARSAELTSREAEILRLLAQGLTSSQIANQLVIGVATVNFHLRSIYGKLGVNTRSAATRYALDHRLA